MEEKIYKLSEVEKLTKSQLLADTLKKKISRGLIQGIRIAEGRRQVWGIAQSTLDYLLADDPPDEYQGLIDEWEYAQTHGTHIENGKPLSKNTIDSHKRSLVLYWDKLGIKKSIKGIAPANFKLVMESIKIDDENQNCHYSQRLKIYDALNSLYNFLFGKGLKTKEEQEAFRKARPQAKYKSRKKLARKNKVEKLLSANESQVGGRSDLDVKLLKTVILLFYMTGLRRNELIELKLQDVDLSNRVLYVMGKGGKYRNVAIPNELAEVLEDWIKHRPKTKNKHLLVQPDGNPLNRSIIQNRLERLRNRAKVPDATPHALRRGYATELIAGGVNPNDVRLALGHSSLKVTEVYIMNDEMEAAENIKKFNFGLFKEKKAKKSRKQKALEILDSLK